MGTFEIKTRSNGEFHFNLKAPNGKVILTSESYTTKASCKNGIESVKANSQLPERFEKLTAESGQLYFNLRATNGQVIGTSEMYESASGRDNGIRSVSENAPEAEIREVE